MNVTQEDSMSKNKDSDSETDIYGDLPNFSSDNTISELENAKKNVENELKAMQLKLKEIQIENDKLKKENEALSINISSLYKTAACEIKRKDQMIQELRKEKDSILFRRRRNETQKYSRRHNAQPEQVSIIDDYHQPSTENEVCITEENRQQDYTSYQNANDVQYYENYGEDEVYVNHPEEDEDDCIQNTPQEVPDTIFTRRKVQQLKLIMKNSDSLKVSTKSDSLKDSTKVDVRSNDPEIIIEDSNEPPFDRRKEQKQKPHNEQHYISKPTVEVDTACSAALDNHAFIVKEKSSTITAGSKNSHLSHKKTELSSSKYLDTARKTVETNVKTSSKVNELPSALVKATQSSRTEDVKVSRTKSHHKPKEHSDVDKSRRAKHSHVSSKDKRSGSDTHSHKKSSSSSRSKFSTHSSSHRSPAKNSFCPRSPKGRSMRETSVSRALKSLRSSSQLKDLDYKSSRSLKERDRHKEIDNKGNKKGESHEHKKTDYMIVKSQISSKLIPEKSQPKITPQPDIQILTEIVCTKPKLAPDPAKLVVTADSQTSSRMNQDIYVKTKSHSEKHNALQQERVKSNEKEQYKTQTDKGGNEEGIMEGQTAKMSHKEDSKTLMVNSTSGEDITEVQGNSGELSQEGNSEVMADRKTLDSEVPRKSDKLHKGVISQKDSVSKVSQHSSSSKNKNICERTVYIDLAHEKSSGEMPVANREVAEDVPTNVDEQHESITEVFTGGDVLHNKNINEEGRDVESVHNEDIIKDSLVSTKRSNKASDDSNMTPKTTLPNLESEVNITDSLLKSKINTNNTTPTELKTQDENLEPDRKSAGTLQVLVTTSEEEVKAPDNSNPSSNSHVEENNTLNSSHKKNRICKSFHIENLQNIAIKDSNKHCSFHVIEIELPEISSDVVEDGQVISSTIQKDVEERNISKGISEEQSVSEDKSVHCLVNNKASDPSLQELVNESPVVEKETITPVSQSLPNPDDSFSPTSTFKKGNVSFVVVNEPGCFRRRKFKRISSNISNNISASNVTKKAVDEHLHNEKLSGTKRPCEHLDAESSISPPAKKQAFADPQRDEIYPSTIIDKSGEDSSQRHLESNNTQTEEKNTSVIEANNSNDKNNTSDLEEGEIEDSDNDEKTSEGNKKLSNDLQEVKVIKSVIHIESNIRKEQSRKYLEIGRKGRENRRKPHGSHLQEVSRGNSNKHLPKKLFSHCKRRSPSELLIRDRNIKVGRNEKDQNSRSRSTSSETSRNTNEFNKNESLKARYGTKENKADTKSNCLREEKKKTNDKAKASSTNKTVLQNMHVNKQKDLSAWTRLGNLSSNEGSRKENNTTLNENNQNSFKIPAISNQTVTPVTKYVIKRRKACNLQDNVSVPVVNISPPKVMTVAKNVNTDENFKSLHLKTVSASSGSVQASQVNSRKTNFSTHSRKTPISKTSTSASRSGASQTNVNCNRISADSKSLVRLCKTLTSQVSSDSSAFSSSSSCEYENNSDETWKPKRRRKRKSRKNPKTEVTKSKAKDISL